MSVFWICYHISWQESGRLQWLDTVSSVLLLAWICSLCGPIKTFLLSHDSISRTAPPKTAAHTMCTITTDTDTCLMLRHIRFLQLSKILVLPPRATSPWNATFYSSSTLPPFFQLSVSSRRAVLGSGCHSGPYRARLEIPAAKIPSNCEFNPKHVSMWALSTRCPSPQNRSPAPCQQTPL